VDIAAGVDPDQAASIVLAELHDPNHRLAEVAYGPQGRVTLTAGATAAQV
jgi:hypothetical protein